MARIIGTSGDDRYPRELIGTAQADEIFGLAGDDSLLGLSGNDILVGGPGADELFGSAGIDFASYKTSRQGVSIDLQYAIGGNGEAEGDTLYSIEGVIGSDQRDYLFGSFDGDILRGEGGSDYILGGDGNDVLAGGAGSDLLIGSSGADELRGDSGIDFTMYYDSAQAVNVDLATGRGRGGTAEGDWLVSVEGILGSDSADRLMGSGAANQFAGERGADTLAGRGGADRFFYLGIDDSTPEAPDRILDFSRSQGDKIVIGAIDAVLEVPGSQRFEFIGRNEFTHAGQIRWYQQNGDTIIEGDTTDLLAGAEFKLVLDTPVSLNASDFIFADLDFGPYFPA